MKKYFYPLVISVKIVYDENVTQKAHHKMNTANATAITTTRIQGAALEYNNDCQDVSVWQWYGYGWNCLNEKVPFWRCQFIKPNQAILLFPVGINPNTLEDRLCATDPIEPTPKPTTRLEYYGDIEDPRAAVVYSFKPQYLQPKRYRVKHFGDNVYGCSCPAGIHGKKCKHVESFREIIKAEKGKVLGLKREPVEIYLIKDGFPFCSFQIYYGIGLDSHYLGRISCKSKSKAQHVAERVADEFYRRRLLLI